MNKFIISALTVFSILFFAQCDMIEYSPNQKFDGDTPENINLKNINRLLVTPGDDTIRIAFTGDSQRFYDEGELLVDKINTISGVDFMILAGDISDFGLLNEFEWIHHIFSRLNVPYLAVIGNHDITANGDHIYKRMYGPLNFSFVYDSVKFIFHNTNSREYNFNGKVPDLDWLKNEFAYSPDVKHQISVSHVPPFDPDFDKDLEKDYHQLFRESGGFIASLHGHLHKMGDGYPYQDSIRYINSSAVGKREFILIDIVDGKIINKNIITF
jgi:3',5'-cyclic-AMP phosphodiesterase